MRNVTESILEPQMMKLTNHKSTHLTTIKCIDHPGRHREGETAQITANINE
jgi:hypothetical protein